MEERLRRIAAWFEKQPWNRPGTDKTWVLTSADAHRRWREAVRDGRRAPRR
jgi:hypothetical protein